MDKRRQKRKHLLYYLEIFDVSADISSDIWLTLQAKG